MKLVLAAALGTVALFGSDARAADTLATNDYYAGAAPIAERVRTICDEYGQCWRERSPRRIIIERRNEGYYEPRERYAERRYDPDRPYARIGIDTSQVNVDVDDDDDDDD